MVGVSAPLVLLDHPRYLRSGAYRRQLADKIERLGVVLLEVRHAPVPACCFKDPHRQPGDAAPGKGDGQARTRRQAEVPPATELLGGPRA